MCSVAGGRAQHFTATPHTVASLPIVQPPRDPTDDQCVDKTDAGLIARLERDER